MPNIDLLSMHKRFLNNHIKKGGTVADFTLGNGHDTAWLAEAVGEEGHAENGDATNREGRQKRSRGRRGRWGKRGNRVRNREDAIMAPTARVAATPNVCSRVCRNRSRSPATQ